MKSDLPSFGSLIDRWKKLSSGHRRIGVLVLCVPISLLSWLMIQHHASTRLVPLNIGESWTREDLGQLESQFSDRGLSGFRIEDDRILVPESSQTEFEEAARSASTKPSDWASEWEKKYEATNPFTSSRKLQMLKEIALAKELKRMIQSLDGVEEASVVWASSTNRSLTSREDVVTATVNLRSESRESLPDKTIRAIQFSVANMIPKLLPENVVVFDSRTGQHYQMDPRLARFESDFESWLARERQDWNSRLNAVVKRNWPNANLTIDIDESSLHSFALREWHRLTSETNPVLARQNSTEDDLGFDEIRWKLSSHVPEFFQIDVMIPKQQASNGTRQEPLPDTEQLAAWVHREISSLLPLSVSDQAIRVVLAEPGSEFAKPTHPDSASGSIWQPILFVSVLTAGIYLTLRQLQGRVSSDSSNEDSEPANDDVQTVPVGTVPVVARETATPLGDPEAVAEALQNWMNSSGK